MKNLSLLLLAILLSVAAISQTKRFYHQNYSPDVMKQRLDSMLFVNYDWEIEKWVNSSKSLFHYDNNGLMLEYVDYGYNVFAEEWVPLFKEEYIYNASHKLAEVLYSDWDEIAEEWDLTYKDSLEYNEGKLARIVYYEMFMGWMIYSKTEFQYNTAGMMTMYEDFDFDIFQNDWANNYKCIFTRNANQLITKESGFFWDMDQWVHNEEISLTYNQENCLTERTEEWWNYENSSWEYSYKSILSYLPGDTVVESSTNYEWNNWQLSWDPDYKYDFNYDANWTSDRIIYPYQLEVAPYFFRHKMDSYVEFMYDVGSNDWLVDFRANYFYSTHDIIGIDEPVEFSFKVFPNPASDYVRVHSDGLSILFIEIFDLQGRKLVAEWINDNSSLYVGSLQPGIYIVRLNNIANQQLIISDQ